VNPVEPQRKPSSILGTVMVLNLNGIDYIEEVLEAVCAQTVFERLQVIVLDQGSSDGSRELIDSRFGDRLELIDNGHNLGAAGGSNVGFRRAEGKYLLRLDSDAVPKSSWAEELLAAAEANRTAGMCTSKIMFYEDSDRIDCVGHTMWPDGLNRSRGNGEVDNGQYDSEQETLFASGCAALYRREDVERVGGFDEDFFVYGDDAELGMNLRLQNLSCLYVPTAVVFHHGSRALGQASLRKVYLIERNRVWVMLKYFPVSWILRSPWYTLRRLVGAWLVSRRGTGIAGRIMISSSTWRVAVTILSAWLAAAWSAPKMLIKRRQIMAASRLSTREISDLLRRFRPLAGEMHFGEAHR